MWAAVGCALVVLQPDDGAVHIDVEADAQFDAVVVQLRRVVRDGGRRIDADQIVFTGGDRTGRAQCEHRDDESQRRGRGDPAR